MPLRCCIVCKAEASPDLQLQYCAAYESALYCTEACQKIDWRKQHKKLCKLLNVGHGDMQLRSDTHTAVPICVKEAFERSERILTEDTKRFFKLFKESTFEGRRVAARKMREITERQTNNQRRVLLFHSLHFLVRFSDSEMLSWPNSPLLVLLQFVNPHMLSGNEDAPLRDTPLHHLADLADLADHSDNSTHVNQLILARQLIEYGANVIAASIPHGRTPLHNACLWGNVTNLDFVELLLEKGADPNAQDHSTGLTPLMYTTKLASGAAKFLLNWPTTVANITDRSGASTFLTRVRNAVKCFSDQISSPDNPDQIQHQFLLHQWRDIEVMMVERSP
jgi:hypothetical protein